MSIIEDLGAQIRAAADDLPLALIVQALQRLELAEERLRWVRQESANPMGVPELSTANEHAEAAGHALRVAQEQLAEYLAAIGLVRDEPAPAATGERRPRHDAPLNTTPVAGVAEPAETPAARRWWSERVTELTGHSEGSSPEPDERVTDSEELLRRVAEGVRSSDRGRLHIELRRAHADVGLGMAAITPPLLRDLATQMLGHPPRGQDLDRLRHEVSGGVRNLLPGLPAPVLETLLTRVCRMPPPPKQPADQPHPADPAVASGVLTGLLLHRLGREVPRRRESDD